MYFVRRYFLHLFFLALALGIPGATKVYAADTDLSAKLAQTSAVEQPALVQKVALIALFSVMPFAIMLLTSFLKMVVVLSLLRQALGVQNSPPNAVLNGIALLMAIYVMFPTVLAMYKESESYIEENTSKATQGILSDSSVEFFVGILERSREPMRIFLTKNSINKHVGYFYQLAKQKFPPPFQTELKPTDFIVLIPAYITSQVKMAFEIGILIYLPFFVIDLVVSNILLAMGMMMLSPLTIALPLKLLLLVMIDGWTLLVQGVVLTYK